jgi:DNA polymerase elongation subunit (family B)
MTKAKPDHFFSDPLLMGADPATGLMAVEHGEGGARDQMTLFWRKDGRTVETVVPFSPFMLLAREELLTGLGAEAEVTGLEGDAPFRWKVNFPTWKSCQQAKTRLAKETGAMAGNPQAPYFLLTDPVQHYLIQAGQTLFKGLQFGEVRRMQVDIECFTTPGYDFCNADRDGDRIIAIAMGDSSGWREVLSGADYDEKTLLERFVATVRERDPDVLEGHNIFNFDLPYLTRRAQRHGVKLAIGRNGAKPASRPSRFSVGERTLSFTRYEVFGRHIVDTYFMVQAYDLTHRSLEGYGLKEVARHFGIAPANRTMIDGSEISAEFTRNPEKLMRYALHDIEETEALSRLLSQSAFIQAQMIPLSYQNIAIRGNATKIDALILREYLRQKRAIPLPERGRPFAGGYTDLFMQGVIQNVQHCDVRSLYPSLMLTRQIGPKTDSLGVFHKLLEQLRRFRLDARRHEQAAASDGERLHFGALQATFKILINSFYGYLGFDQVRFSDFDAAERVALEGRALLHQMIDWLKTNGAQPVEIDTDGVYFVPPPGGGAAAQASFRSRFASSLPQGIEVEFDGEYVAMFSYKMKNYALLTDTREIIIKGAALKSRGLEPFQRKFLREMIRLKLEGKEAALPDLKAEYEAAISERRWPIALLAKTETLQDAPATYAAKIEGKGRGRNAAYELALKSGRDYRAGDQLSYYVAGTRKTVQVFAAARLVAEWNPVERDENVPYYVAKLDALYDKFCGGKLGGEREDE